MKCTRVVLFALLLIGLARTQSRWTRTYGGFWADHGRFVQLTADSGYIVTGHTENFGAGLTDFYLIKTDGSGDTIWTRTYGDSGYQSAYSVRQTADRGFVMVGPTMPPWGAVFDILVVKTDSSGDTVWTSTWAGVSDDEGRDIRQTSDGGYIVVGRTTSIGAGANDIVLVRLTGSGDSVWVKTIGRSGHDIGYSVLQTSDSGYIVTGLTYSPVTSSEDVCLVKVSPTGDTVWIRTYGGTGNDAGQCVQQTADGGYIIAGYFNSGGGSGFDVYLVKTDASGDPLWTRAYGGSYYDIGCSVEQTSDSGFVVAGTSYIGPADANAYIIRTNALGDTLWTRTFGASGSEGGNSVRQALDGGYVIAGGTTSFGAGSDDVWLIKTDAEGYAGVDEPEGNGGKTPANLNVVPNPFVSSARVPGHEAERFDLYDVAGKKRRTFTGSRVGEGLPPAVYFLQPAGRQCRSLRVVKVK